MAAVSQVSSVHLFSSWDLVSLDDLKFRRVRFSEMTDGFSLYRNFKLVTIKLEVVKK